MTVAGRTIPVRGDGCFRAAQPVVCPDSALSVFPQDFAPYPCYQQDWNALLTTRFALVYPQRFSPKRHSNHSSFPDTAPFM